MEINASVVVMLVGVTIATVTDVDVHLPGLVVGLICTLAAGKSFPNHILGVHTNLSIPCFRWVSCATLCH